MWIEVSKASARCGPFTQHEELRDAPDFNALEKKTQILLTAVSRFEASLATLVEIGRY